MADKGKKKAKNKSGQQEENSHSTKKPSMKTASDVISRLLWDDALPQEQFTVGYLDRFDGIVEKPFTALDWNDPAIVDNYSLALPKHRIQYFKYRNRKVWDKTTRKDYVFGSTGACLSIHEFMASIDQEKLDFCDEALMSKRYGIEPIDSDDKPDEIDYEMRANFFVAARITNKDTIKNLKKVADYMKSRDELIGECCIAPELYHLTLCILKLDSPRDVFNAISAISKASHYGLPSPTLKLEGLDNFHQRVLYARVEKNNDLHTLRKNLVDALASSTITDKFSFVPHVTIAKLSRPICRLRHSKFIDQYLYLKFEDESFGSADITELCLCEMGDARDRDGFYNCAFRTPLDPGYNVYCKVELQYIDKKNLTL